MAATYARLSKSISHFSSRIYSGVFRSTGHERSEGSRVSSGKFQRANSAEKIQESFSANDDTWNESQKRNTGVRDIEMAHILTVYEAQRRC